MSLSDMTWTCHVCGADRPDAKISVDKFKGRSGEKMYRIPITYNIRFCNDRAECRAGTRAVAEDWAARVGAEVV